MANQCISRVREGEPGPASAGARGMSLCVDVILGVFVCVLSHSHLTPLFLSPFCTVWTQLLLLHERKPEAMLVE